MDDADTDLLAERLVSGEESCESCQGLRELVYQVRSGELDIEEFKRILRETKAQQLSETS
jgi:hypothetical protein